jgi:hypothetical protein
MSTQEIKLTQMVKTRIHLSDDEHASLHDIAERSGRSVADLVREAVRRIWLRPRADGPVGLWNGKPRRTSVEHDTIYDEP